ncbi:MAG: hypothetical protein OEY89_16140 [Gammaproteobacteria bacterium]|nr:hypothetical protein [Gammaproteobacteria bacterium]
MSKKEEYTTALECPNCNNKGSARWEENENPVHGEGYAQRLLSVSEEFTKEGDNNVKCNNCGAKIR